MAQLQWLEIDKEIEDKRIASWLEQFQRNVVEMSLNTGQYDVLTVAPEKPRQGLVVYADGTNWNPGSGEGVYRFNGSTWVFMG